MVFDIAGYEYGWISWRLFGDFANKKKRKMFTFSSYGWHKICMHMRVKKTKVWVKKVMKCKWKWWWKGFYASNPRLQVVLVRWNFRVDQLLGVHFLHLGKTSSDLGQPAWRNAMQILRWRTSLTHSLRLSGILPIDKTFDTPYCRDPVCLGRNGEARLQMPHSAASIRETTPCLLWSSYLFLLVIS